jgi:hypothetical protein
VRSSNTGDESDTFIAAAAAAVIALQIQLLLQLSVQINIRQHLRNGVLVAAKQRV